MLASKPWWETLPIEEARKMAEQKVADSHTQSERRQTLKMVPSKKPVVTMSQGAILSTLGEWSNPMNYKATSRVKNSRAGSNWRAIVIEALGSKCAQCGQTDKLHIDHIMPLGQGGKHCFKNLQLLCTKCHAEKTNIDGYPNLARILARRSS